MGCGINEQLPPQHSPPSSSATSSFAEPPHRTEAHTPSTSTSTAPTSSPTTSEHSGTEVQENVLAVQLKLGKCAEKSSVEERHFLLPLSQENAEIIQKTERGKPKEMLNDCENPNNCGDKNNNYTPGSAQNESVTDWCSITTAGLLTFCSAIQFSLFYSSMWPFMQTFDPLSTERVFGYLVAVYSLGQILACPLVGWLNNRFGMLRPLLCICMALMFTGNVVYACIEHWPVEYRRYAMAIGRFIIGFGSSNIILLRAFATSASVPADRSKAIAVVTCGIAIGMLLGPSFQLVFTPLGHPGPEFMPSIFHFSMYTAPAYMACVVNVICVLLICFVFRENYPVIDSSDTELVQNQRKNSETVPANIIRGSRRGTLVDDPVGGVELLDLEVVAVVLDDEESSKGTSSSEQCSETSTKEDEGSEKEAFVEAELVKTVNDGNFLETNPIKKTMEKATPPYDRIAVYLCYLTRFTMMLIIANIDALGSPLSMLLFGWTRVEAVRYMSTAQVIMSMLGLCIYLLFIFCRLERLLKPRLSCVLAVLMIALFHVFSFSYPFYPGHLKTFSENHIYDNQTSLEHIGCNRDRFNWCDQVKPFTPWLYYSAYTICLGFAFSCINVSLNTLFSKILGPRKQSTQHGLLQMYGSTARLIGPIVISSIYTSMGPQVVWIIDLTIVILTLILWYLFYQRMVPLESKKHRPRSKSPKIRQGHKNTRTSGFGLLIADDARRIPKEPEKCILFVK